jgi:hypothetical protein
MQDIKAFKTEDAGRSDGKCEHCVVFLKISLLWSQRQPVAQQQAYAYHV